MRWGTHSRLERRKTIVFKIWYILLCTGWKEAPTTEYKGGVGILMDVNPFYAMKFCFQIERCCWVLPEEKEEPWRSRRGFWFPWFHVFVASPAGHPRRPKPAEIPPCFLFLSVSACVCVCRGSRAKFQHTRKYVGNNNHNSGLPQEVICAFDYDKTLGGNCIHRSDPTKGPPVYCCNL